MAIYNLITLKSHFNSIHKSFPDDLLQRIMMKVCSFITFVCVLLCGFVFSSFRHLIKHLVGSWKGDDHVHVVFHEEKDRIVESFIDSNHSIFHDGEEKPEFAFEFRFQMKEEELVEKTEETKEVIMDDELKNMTTTSKYQFMSVKDFGGFVAESKSVNFTVHELFVEPPSIGDELDLGAFEALEVEQKSKNKDELKELDEKVDDFIESEILEKIDLSSADSIIFEEECKEAVKNASSFDEMEDLQAKSELNLGENEVLKTEEVNWLEDFIMRNDSYCYGFNSSNESESESEFLDHRHPGSDDSDDESVSLSPQELDSVIEQEPESFSQFVQEKNDNDFIKHEKLENNDEHDEDDENEPDSCSPNTTERETELIKRDEFEEENDANSWEFDSDDSDDDDDDDILLEHEHLIGQMKMELKSSRTGGLPTILEEVETPPRMKEDYKPLQIKEKMEHRDQMAEIHKFYKSYTEKMRKLDVLNYQTLQAINFLRMKHPEQLNTGENASLSAIKSVLFPSLWPCKLRRIYADPTLKSITELHKDLEIVYVGQACLSWEILHWQYKKAKELQLYDPQGFRSYNHVAIEFQQFHVLLKRFSEDELFQGPRVQNYTKQRCTLRGLLQVPAVRDDSLKEKKAMKKEEGDAVSISAMTKIIKESMAVFWEFLHTDKDTTNLFLTIILQGSKANLQDPADSDLFMQLKTTHQKKEKRLKDLLRTGNCIVKKFQKQQETILDQHMFVSQVELKLISRVLNLPRLTRDQLLWCHSKLNNIIFIDRKVQVEDSLFLIFPC
ncbi:hypothetical protein QVD17_29374 [Tagetes erecta]|uniref:Ribosomal protein L34Ae n=1 Tax=Tagetes erecta TaxID=13708 RepID=A0AAD8KBP2_TARER|nr:hypothetical protein QVD17_29374 [Tagetes erecta]